jgi:ABC-2 type transport system permease protein
MLFWTLGFPVILATFFGMAFANISTATEFETIRMGVVNTAEYKADSNFQTHLKAASDASDSSGDPMFELTVFDTQEDAAAALREKTISVIFSKRIPCSFIFEAAESILRS